MKKVTLLALHLSYGGIESSIIKLANTLVNNYEVLIISTYNLGKEAFSIDKRVKIKYLLDYGPNKKEFKLALKKINIINIFKEGFKAIKILSLKKKLMIKALQENKSDITISTRDYLNTLNGIYGNGLKIGWEHNYHNYDYKYIKKICLSAKKLNYFVLVTEDLRKDYEEYFRKYDVSSKAVYIPNYIVANSYQRKEYYPYNLLAVGRLEKEKDFSLLIKAMDKLVTKNDKYILKIVGDGSLKEELAKEIKMYHLEKNVFLTGYKDTLELNKLYQDSGVYLMTSQTESFGLVLVEAMSFGLPCIALKRAHGACNIIEDKINGYLVADIDEMVETIINMDNLPELSLNASKRASFFMEDNVKEQWFKLLEVKE